MISKNSCCNDRTIIEQPKTAETSALSPRIDNLLNEIASIHALKEVKRSPGKEEARKALDGHKSARFDLLKQYRDRLDDPSRAKFDSFLELAVYLHKLPKGHSFGTPPFDRRNLIAMSALDLSDLQTKGNKGVNLFELIGLFELSLTNGLLLHANLAGSLIAFRGKPSNSTCFFGANFSGSELRNALFCGVNARRSNFSEGRFRDCTFRSCDFAGEPKSFLNKSPDYPTSFAGALLISCNFEDCKFNHLTSFSGARLSDVLIKATCDVEPDFSEPPKELDFRGSTCRKVSFKFAGKDNLRMQLSGSSLNEVTFCEGTYNDLDLSKSTLDNVCFDQCTLSNPNLLEAEFGHGCRFLGAEILNLIVPSNGILVQGDERLVDPQKIIELFKNMGARIVAFDKNSPIRP